jgi:hypothetical protein
MGILKNAKMSPPELVFPTWMALMSVSLPAESSGLSELNHVLNVLSGARHSSMAAFSDSGGILGICVFPDAVGLSAAARGFSDAAVLPPSEAHPDAQIKRAANKVTVKNLFKFISSICVLLNRLKAVFERVSAGKACNNYYILYMIPFVNR